MFNVRLACVLVAAVCLTGVSAFFLNRYQVKRHAYGMVELAEAAAAKGRSDRALQLFTSYLVLVPGDTAIRARMGECGEAVAFDPKTRRGVIGVYEQVLEETPGRTDIRLRVAKLCLTDTMLTEAKKHLAVLDTEGDGEAAGLLAVAEDRAGEPAKAIPHYRRAVSLLPNRIDWAARLAGLLRDKPGAEQEADAVVDRMVAANPGKARPLLIRAAYFKKYKADDKAADPAPDLAAALAVEPTNADVCLEAAAAAANPDEARRHLTAALAANPRDVRLPLALAETEFKANKRSDGVAVLRRASSQFPGNPQILFTLANQLLAAGDRRGLRQTLSEIERWKILPEQAALLRARLHMFEGEWQAALTVLESLRPTLTTASAVLGAEADLLQGACLEEMGKGDVAAVRYRSALALPVPADGSARTGILKLKADAQMSLARALIGLNNLEEAVNQYRQLSAAPDAAADVHLMYARLRVLQFISTPPASRNRSDIDATLQQVGKLVPNTMELFILRCEVLSAENKTADAEALLRAELDKHPGESELGVRLSLLLSRQGRFDAAWDVLDGLEKVGGPTVSTTLTRLDMIADRADARHVAVYHQAAELYAGSLKAEERLRLAIALAQTQDRWGDTAAARHWWGEVAHLRPSDLSVYLRQFDYAAKANDRGGMEAAVAEVHRLEGGPGPIGHYMEAMLRVIREVDRTPTSIREAQEHLTQAAILRQNWVLVPVALAVLADFEQKTEEALAFYVRAFGLGERRPVIVRRLVKLLYARGRSSEAAAIIQKFVASGSADPEISKWNAVVSLSSGQKAKAIDLAERLVPADSKDYEDHLWQARIMAAAGQPEKALIAFGRATDAAGPVAAPWVILVRYHVESGHPERAEQIVAQLPQKLQGAELSQALAQSYEALGNWEKAEKTHQDAVAAKPDDINGYKQLFEFYERTQVPIRAIPFLRTLLKADRSLAPADVQWAKRALAFALAISGDYPAFQEALRLAEECLATSPDAEALVLKARVLATRPGSRREAIELLQRVQKMRPLNLAEEYMLAKLYSDYGAWPEGRRMLVGLLAKVDKNPEYLAFYTDRLLRNNLSDEAEAWLSQLEKIAPTDVTTIRLRGKLLVRRGDFVAAAAHLRAAAAAAQKANGGAVDPARFRLIASLAGELASEEGASDVLIPVAEGLYRQTAKAGTAEDKLALATFLGRCGKVAEALQLCQAAEPEAAARALVAACYTVFPQNDTQLDALEDGFRAVAKKTSRSPQMLKLEGLMHARRGRYPDAAEAFRGYAAAGSADGLNNLVYMLILSQPRSQEIGPLIERIIHTAGSTPGLLDTQGMANLANGRVQEAIADFEKAVDQAASAAKCLHLAAAYQRANRPAEAATMLARAEALRSDGGLVLPAEQELYQSVKRELAKKR